MPFPNPPVWNRETADTLRENQKRQTSPCSFFFSHGRSLCLAAEYFTDDRLAGAARNGAEERQRTGSGLAIQHNVAKLEEWLGPCESS